MGVNERGEKGDTDGYLVAISGRYVEGEALLLLLDAHGIAVHSGSSCTADTQEPSHVLAAMGAITHGSVRVSFLGDAGDADVDRLLAVLPAAVTELREMADLDAQAVERSGGLNSEAATRAAGTHATGAHAGPSGSPPANRRSG